MRYDDFVIGYEGSFTTTITEQKNTAFGDLVGDHNPVHYDEDRMRSSIFGRRAANGFLTESTIGSALVRMFTSDQTVVIALEKRIRLLAPVFIGDTITATATVKERFPEKQRLSCDCRVDKHDGTQVVAASFLVKILDT